MKIRFLPKNENWEGQPGLDLMTIAAQAGVILDGNCGGKGTCKKCRVVIDGGSVLACQHTPQHDCTVEIPSDESLTARKAAMSLLPSSFKADNSYAQQASEEKQAYGLAFDIGTTTVVGALYNLKTGESLGIKAQTNPQGVFGADVISRINYVMEEADDAGLERLHRVIITCLDEIASALIKKASLDSEQVYEMSVCGNTTMSHLFAGKNPKTLAVKPFSPAFTGPITTTGLDLGLVTQSQLAVHLLPNIAGHVGSDITADIIVLREKVDRSSRVLLIDIGTNGELYATDGTREIVCSTAAGPAFEGATIKQGMRAAEGAIEKVSINDAGCLEIITIGNTQPVGICGSGIVDAVAVLVETGIVEASGRFTSVSKLEASSLNADLKQRVRKNPDDGRTEFVLFQGENGNTVAITQQDIREVQLGKAALSAGITLLMRDLNLELENLDHVYVAGAFGNHIDLTSAQIIDLIPPCDPSIVEFIGNAAIVGTSMCLLSDNHRYAADSFVDDVGYIELAEDDSFQSEYLLALSF